MFEFKVNANQGGFWLPIKSSYISMMNSSWTNVYFLEKYDGLPESVAFAQNWAILQTRMDQRRDHIKMIFDYFQIQKWML